MEVQSEGGGGVAPPCPIRRRRPSGGTTAPGNATEHATSYTSEGGRTAASRTAAELPKKLGKTTPGGGATPDRPSELQGQVKFVVIFRRVYCG